MVASNFLGRLRFDCAAHFAGNEINLEAGRQAPVGQLMRAETSMQVSLKLMMDPVFKGYAEEFALRSNISTLSQVIHDPNIKKAKFRALDGPALWPLNVCTRGRKP